LKVTVHFTKDEYHASIFETGLVPGAQQGIGAPETKEVDTMNIYVLSGSNPGNTTYVAGEAGGVPIIVISSRGPTSPDVNYEPTKDSEGRTHFGAYTYQAQAPPVRNAGTSPSNLFSFAWPLGARSRLGLAAFVNRATGGTMGFTANEVETLVGEHLRAQFPLVFCY
jgi:hypothetical protein